MYIAANPRTAFQLIDTILLGLRHPI